MRLIIWNCIGKSWFGMNLDKKQAINWYIKHFQENYIPSSRRWAANRNDFVIIPAI